MNIKQFVKVTSATVALAASQLSLASPIHIGDFDLVNASNNHGIWFNSKISHDGVTNDNNYLSLVSGTFSVFENAGDYFANLTGEVYDDDIEGGFTFDVDFSYRCTGITSCGLASQPTGNVSNSVDQEAWDFFDMEDNYAGTGDAVLTGTGSLAGMSVGISQMPSDGSKPFRFGLGADWYNLDAVGGSGWFSVASVEGTPHDVTFDAHRGDFNVTSVPEPGTLALLSIGLIGLGLRRKQQ